jgi:hypothetical protein
MVRRPVSKIGTKWLRRKNNDYLHIKSPKQKAEADLSQKSSRVRRGVAMVGIDST